MIYDILDKIIFYTTKKNNELYHLNCITKISDTILNHLFRTETKNYTFKLFIVVDVIIN